ncbi:TMEM175 family protein [Lactobacillaceae bacterium L1_55_11]|nr:TMEM175 family protein [Lactobacillaceae bacterium L1_55_11]
MSKARFEAFTDAVIAIVVTIMVLELHVPEHPTFQALFEKAPYFFAYIVSSIFVGTAWYNHHYMTTIINHISKKIYWLNNFWLFSMSLIPLATGWVGEYINYRDPEIFYLLVFVFWGFTYTLLSKAVYQQLAAEDNHPERIHNMPIYQKLTSYSYIIFLVIVFTLVLIYPPLGIISTLLIVINYAFRTTPDSDQLDN